MSQRLVSILLGVAAFGLLAGTASAESRGEVLERIRPVGQVAVEGQAPAQATAPAKAPVEAAAPAAPAPVAAAPAAEPAPAAAAPAATASDGSALYVAKGCVACHGADANSPVMSTYPKLAGLPAPYTANQMKDIKSGARNNGQTMLMKGIMAGVSDEEIQAIADWLATL